MVSKILKFSGRMLIGAVVSSPIILGQVIIRERLPIDPKPEALPQASAAAGATLRFEFRYAGPTREPDLNSIRVRNIVCGVDQTGSLNSSISVPAQSGIWSFSARVHTPAVSGVYAVTSVYLNSDLIQKDSTLINCGSTCQINLSSGVTLSNTFNFTGNSYVFYTEQASIGTQASGQVHCTNELWHPGLPVTLSIVSGADRGQFANAQGDTLGDVVTVPGRDVGTITFLADGIEPDSISDFVTIQASSFGITRTATIEVLRVSPSPIWLGVRAQGDVSYGAEMYLEAQALDMFQSEVGAGSGVTYTFEIIEGSQWGSLFRLAAEGNKIENVVPTNGFFSKGYAFVGFRARKQEPDGPKRVTVEVRASDPSIRAGTYSFYVLPSPLAISVVPPEVGYGEQATILVQKKNPDGSVSPWPADAGLYFEIIKGGGAGYIFHEDTSSRNDWFDGQSSTVLFTALEESPQPDTVEVQFYVQVYDEGSSLPPVIVKADSSVPRPKMSTLSSSGALAWGPVPPNAALRRTGLVAVKAVKSSYKLSLIAKKTTLIPLSDTDNKANPSFNKDGPDKRKKIIDWSNVKSTEIEVYVTDAEQRAIKDYSFTLKTFSVPNSGGHDHIDERPLGRFIMLKETLSTVQGKTDDAGKAKFTYLCSGIGGLDSIYLKGSGERDTATSKILIRVDSLQELTPGDHYELIGSYGEPGVNSRHKRNHYGTKNLIAKLKALADTAYADKKYKMRINDMSLNDGGPFDIENDWDTPHENHRDGASADVDNEVRTSDGKRKSISKDKLVEWLKGTVKNYSAGSEGDHFHVTIR